MTHEEIAAQVAAEVVAYLSVGAKFERHKDREEHFLKVVEIVKETLNKFAAHYEPVPEPPADGDTIDDGFGSVWSAWCSECGRKSMEVMRPGDARCQQCYDKPAAPSVSEEQPAEFGSPDPDLISRTVGSKVDDFLRKVDAHRGRR